MPDWQNFIYCCWLYYYTAAFKSKIFIFKKTEPPWMPSIYLRGPPKHNWTWHPVHVSNLWLCQRVFWGAGKLWALVGKPEPSHWFWQSNRVPLEKVSLGQGEGKEAAEWEGRKLEWDGNRTGRLYPRSGIRGASRHHVQSPLPAWYACTDEHRPVPAVSLV